MFNRANTSHFFGEWVRKMYRAIEVPKEAFNSAAVLILVISVCSFMLFTIKTFFTSISILYLPVQLSIVLLFATAASLLFSRIIMLFNMIPRLYLVTVLFASFLLWYVNYYC